MTRAQEPRPPSTSRSNTHPEDALSQERARYLVQEISEAAEFLEQWIVHYLAELLDRAHERKASPRVRSEARAEIARVIPALWEQQIAREAVRVRQNVNHRLLSTDTVDSESCQLLGPLLADPRSAASVDEGQVATALRAMHALAELVTRFLVTTDFAARMRREVTSDAVRLFLRQDEEVQKLQEALVRIVPDFAALDPTDEGAVAGLTYQVMLALTEAQLILLTRVLPRTKSDSRKPGAPVRRRRQSTPSPKGLRKRGPPASRS